MSTGFKIKLLKLMSGERLPLLLDDQGRPLFEPTVYAITELRARNQATNTISSNLRAIQVFYLFLHLRSIDLSLRLSAGQLLSLGEVEDLTRLCRLPVRRLDSILNASVERRAQTKATSFEKARLRLLGEEEKEVEPAFAGTRMHYIRGYIGWLVSDRLSRLGLDSMVSDNLLKSLNRVLSALAARIPRGGSHGTINQREGLSSESIDELFRIVSPQSLANPWRGDYARHRNSLIVHWLYHLGLRRGELLGIKVCDIDFRKGTVTIHRRADDPSDPRTNQPQSKTKAREIPLNDGLKLLTYTYVMNHRSALVGARKHDFLFCADVTGRPMSLPTLNKVFNVMREKCLGLPNSLCPHVMRHTWNDRFSEEMDKQKTSEESEKKIRSYLMGWSETSGTAYTYTRRHTRKKAQQVSLKMQRQMKGGGKAVRNLISVQKGLDTIPNLPEEARSHSGVPFNPRTERWSYRDNSENVSLNFTKFKLVTNSFMVASKLTLLWYAENTSQSHLVNMYRRLEHLLRIVTYDRVEPLNEITSRDLINYRATLRKRDSWYLGALSGLLQKWYELGYSGVTDDAVALLKQLRIAGNIKGEAVLTMDPDNGPFTDIEVQSIQTGLDRRLSDGQISLESYLIVYLYMLLGQRSVQYAGLKVRDVGVSLSKDEVAVYTLRIPRAKQRARHCRTDFKDRVLIPQIGKLLVAYANQIRTEYANRLPDSSEAPLFPAKQERADAPAGFKFHRTSGALADSLERALNKLNITSERTGKPIKFTARRFRRTVGTRAATEGHGELIIAELLDHTDTQNVGVYVEATPGIVERIDRAVAMQLAPLAQAFAGVLITDESQATRAGDPASRICDPRFNAAMKPMGNCGKHGFCGLLAPLACYTCSNFQPWLDGPHQTVLSYLISERERLRATSDVRIASINDRTILAVAEVVMRCDEIRQEVRKANV